jgi:hypothetical protein
MNKKVEFLLTVLALAGLYSAIPKNISRADNSGIRTEQTMIVADGTDPMPLCRKHCTQADTK